MKRTLLWLVSGTLLAPLFSRAADMPFDFEVLQFRAKTLASKPYEQRPTKVTRSLTSLTYDQYRDIRFDPSKSLWRKDHLPFEVQFFHPGFIYNKTVQIYQVENGPAELVPFSTQLFNYGPGVHLTDVPSDVGFTGFRVHAPLNSAAYYDELVVFQGASYFRALGQGMRYGMSARGLALNTGEPGGEEFPIFEEFYLRKLTVDAKELKVYALMDSPSVTGAYEFTIKPGVSTFTNVHAVVYQRANTAIKSFGIAPLTSMFWHGENSTSRDDDLRPEVHDSDGLMMERGSGEWLWRPLENPKAVQIVAFNDENPRGFGLVQRDRKYEDYEDTEAAYHLRPSTWVQPKGNWGAGSIRLVEIPTPDETNDNIVAFWVPQTLPTAGTAIEFSYDLQWFMENGSIKRPPAGRTIATRIGHSRTHEPELERFWVDFDSGYLETCSPNTAIEAVVTVGEGAKLVHQGLQKNLFNNTWRVAFALKPDGSGKPVELRCFLKKEPHILTETWSYLWTP